MLQETYQEQQGRGGVQEWDSYQEQQGRGAGMGQLSRTARQGRCTGMGQLAPLTHPAVPSFMVRSNPLADILRSIHAESRCDIVLKEKTTCIILYSSVG